MHEVKRVVKFKMSLRQSCLCLVILVPLLVQSLSHKAQLRHLSGHGGHDEVAPAKDGLSSPLLENSDTNVQHNIEEKVDAVVETVSNQRSIAAPWKYAHYNSYQQPPIGNQLLDIVAGRSVLNIVASKSDQEPQFNSYQPPQPSLSIFGKEASSKNGYVNKPSAKQNFMDIWYGLLFSLAAVYYSLLVFGLINEQQPGAQSDSVPDADGTTTIAPPNVTVPDVGLGGTGVSLSGTQLKNTFIPTNVNKLTNKNNNQDLAVETNLNTLTQAAAG
jgi:hypothetical protein